MKFKIIIPALCGLLLAIPFSLQASTITVCAANTLALGHTITMGVKLYYKDPGSCPQITWSSAGSTMAAGQKKTFSKTGLPATTKVYVCAAHTIVLTSWGATIKKTLANNATLILKAVKIKGQTKYVFEVTSGTCK